MTGIYLDVPYVSQLAISGDRSRNDWTGCWYASACMLAYYFESGPRRGDPSLWNVNGSGYHAPIVSADNLRRNENLVEFVPGKIKPWGLTELAEGLRKWGPMLLSFKKTAAPHWKVNGGGGVELAGYNLASSRVEYGHCCALIGVDESRRQIIYHDPENGRDSRMHISKFNDLYYWGFEDCMLRKDVSAHTPKRIAM